MNKGVGHVKLTSFHVFKFLLKWNFPAGSKFMGNTFDVFRKNGMGILFKTSVLVFWEKMSKNDT